MNDRKDNQNQKKGEQIIEKMKYIIINLFN